MKKNFDKKEYQMINYYCARVANRQFDERDIYSFLILIRDHFDSNEKYNKGTPTDSRKYKWLSEFGDLIAHRGRNDGVISNSIAATSASNYTTEAATSKLKKYDGIEPGILEKEIYDLFCELKFNVTNQIVAEIILCVFSILNFSRYTHRRANINGEIRIVQAQKGLMLCTNGDITDKGAFLVGLAVLEGYFIKTKFPGGIINVPIEVVRHNGELVIMCDNQIL